MERNETNDTRAPTTLSPRAVIVQTTLQVLLARALAVAAELGIADLVSREPKSPAELAAATGAHADALHRLLRMLASHGVFAEDDRGRFQLTPLAAVLQTGSADSLRDFLRFFSGDMAWNAYRDLLHTVRTGEYGFAHAYGMGFFAYLAAHPDVEALFSAAMAQATARENAAIAGAYAFGQFARLVDVGGGRGGLLAAVLTAYPTVQGTSPCTERRTWMQFGIAPCLPDLSHVEQRERLFDEIIAEAQVAEQVGFDSCLMTEHHQHSHGSFPSPLLVAAAIAAKTTRLRVGSGVLLLPLYHPVRVAEDGAMVDLLSKGRLILGVGAGVVGSDFAAVGVPRRQRPSRFEEGLQIVKRAWTEESVSFFGRRYQLHNVAVTPKPWQQPHPPIWVGGMADEGIKRAARLGDAWFMDILNNTHTLGQRAVLYRHTCTQWGKSPYIAALREAWVADTTAQADQEYAPHVMGFHRGAYRAGAYHPSTEPWLATVTSEAEFTFEKVKQDRFIVGSHEDCIQQIEALQHETGVNYLVLRFRHPTGPTHAQVCQAIQRFGEQVIPHFV